MKDRFRWYVKNYTRSAVVRGVMPLKYGPEAATAAFHAALAAVKPGAFGGSARLERWCGGRMIQLESWAGKRTGWEKQP
jgi:hypothetical protein